MDRAPKIHKRCINRLGYLRKGTDNLLALRITTVLNIFLTHSNFVINVFFFIIFTTFYEVQKLHYLNLLLPST
jgi:hypothetical protein